MGFVVLQWTNVDRGQRTQKKSLDSRVSLSLFCEALMNMNTNTLCVLLAFCLLASFSCFALGSSLEVLKSVTAGTGNGISTVSVGYRSVGHSGRVYGVTIVDSLPKTLELVSGELV